VFAEVLEELLASGHEATFRVEGDSMFPTILWGDQVRIVATNDVHAGDVVLARAARGLTAHRIVSLTGSQIIMRGDNAPANDPPVEIADVLGRIISLRREGRTFSVRPLRSMTIQRLRAVGSRLFGSLQISRKTNAVAMSEPQLRP
jgi:hypothetical protein